MVPIDSQEPEKTKKPTWLAKIRIFLAEVKQELNMISFPTWQEVRERVIIVLVVIFVLSVYIFVVDQLCKRYLDPTMFWRR